MAADSGLSLNVRLQYVPAVPRNTGNGKSGSAHVADSLIILTTAKRPKRIFVAVHIR